VIISSDMRICMLMYFIAHQIHKNTHHVVSWQRGCEWQWIFGGQAGWERWRYVSHFL